MFTDIFVFRFPPSVPPREHRTVSREVSVRRWCASSGERRAPNCRTATMDFFSKCCAPASNTAFVSSTQPDPNDPRGSSFFLVSPLLSAPCLLPPGPTGCERLPRVYLLIALMTHYVRTGYGQTGGGWPSGGVRADSNTGSHRYGMLRSSVPSSLQS